MIQKLLKTQKLTASATNENKMLVVTRRVGEIIRINDDIEVVLLSIRGSQVRIGVRAPLSHVIHRDEIYKRIQAESLAENQGD